MRIAMVVLFILLCAAVWAQGEIVVGQTIPVTSYVPDRQMSQFEWDFLKTIPLDGGLREACRQMLQAKIIHATKEGYRKGDSVRYWTAYQVWTAPYRAVLSLPPLPPCEEITPPRLELDEIPECKRPAVVCCPGRVGSYQIGRAGSYRETTVGGFLFGGGGGSCPPRKCSSYPPSPIVPPPVPPPCP